MTESQTPASLSAGVHDLSAEEYHADRMCAVPTLSSTLARLLLTRSPRHAWHASPRLNPDHDSIERKTFDIGRAAHRTVLGKGADYLAVPEDLLSDDGGIRTKAAKEWVAARKEEGLTVLKPVEIEMIHDMAGEIMGRLSDMRITFPPGRSELTAIGEIDGVICRAMIDHAPADPAAPLWDLKTTTDASMDAVQRTIMTYGYDTQAAHYTETWKAATGEDREFRFVFVEKDAPHEVCVVQLGGDSMAMARKRTARAREMWAHCLRSGTWPGYPTGIVQMDMPDWYQARWLERETTEADIRRSTGRDALARSYDWQKPFHQEA